MKAHASPQVAPRKAARAARRAGPRQQPRQVKQVNAPRIDAAVLEGLEQINLHAAGIDVGGSQNYVAVPAQSVKAGAPTVRAFGVFTAELEATQAWLKECGITTVAMEATGIYWMALYDKLEAAGIAVVLVEPHSVKQVPGRKSDVLDCQWLMQLHTYGLLRGSFRPDEPIRRLRILTRQRLELVQGAAACQQHIQHALIPMNLQLHLVVSDVVGETGLRILEAILGGERDPEALVKLRDPRCKKSTVDEMKAALKGHYTTEGLFVLQQSLDLWKVYQGELGKCDAQIERVLAHLPTARAATQPVPPKPVPPAAESPSAKTRKKKVAGGNNELRVDPEQLGAQLQRLCGVNLMAVCGLNLLSVLMLIAEIGVDMSRWPNAKAFCSWLGLCPGTKISGGKVLSRRTRKVVNRASVILRVAVLAIGRTESWLGRFYRRKKAHLGAPKAITATARKLACVVYHMLKYQENYLPLDVALYELKAQEQRMKWLRRQAHELGCELVESKQAA
jgi:transposase